MRSIRATADRVDRLGEGRGDSTPERKQTDIVQRGQFEHTQNRIETLRPCGLLGALLGDTSHCTLGRMEPSRWGPRL